MANNNLEASLRINASVNGQNSINELNQNLQESNRTLEDTTEQASRAGHEFSSFAQAVQNIGVGRQGLNDIANLVNTLEEAGGTVDNLRGRYQHLADEWDNLDTTQQSQRVRRLREYMASLGDSMQDVVRNSHTLDTSLAENSQSLKKVGKASDALEKGMNKLQGLLATLGVTMGASELIQMADAFKNLEGRVKLATGEGANFISGFEGVQEIANATFSSVEDTGELFARITQAGEAMGLAQQEVLKITETINQAVKLSGGSAEAGQQAITQLIQGLQSGVLRGEEFNSVLEQSPRLARAMADGLGVSIGQLRAMANEGKLTSEVVIGAVQGQADAINKEFSSLPLTVGNSLIQLKNNVMRFVGDIDKEINSSGGLATVIQNISEGISEIDPTTMDAIKEAFTQLGAVAKELWNSVAQGAENFQDLLNIANGVDESTEKVNFLVRTVQGLSVAFGAVADGLKALQITSDVAIGGITLAIGKLSQGLAKIGLLPDSLQEKFKQVGDDLVAMSDGALQRAEQNALKFQSSTTKALDNASKSQQQRLQETAEKSRLAYEQMASDGKASTEQLEQAFVEYATNAIKANNNLIDDRLKAELAEKNLQAVISETGKIIIESSKQSEQAVKNMSAEYEKASNSFKTIGLDIGEFSTGISSKITEPIQAFSDVVKLAENDTQKLALAYNATKAKVGESKQAQELLNAELLKSVNGNQQLANAVRQQALAQQNAKNATDNQSKALQALGINMDAINAKMSVGGLKMAENLKAGIGAIKQQAKSAQSLKTALTQALDVSLQSAKTQADFKAIQKTLQETGTISNVTAEQIQKISTGASGGEQAVKKLATTTKESTQAVSDNSTASRENASAKREQVSAIQEVEQADNQATQSQQSNASSMLEIYEHIMKVHRSRLDVLKETGATTEQIEKAYMRLNDKYFSVFGREYISMESFFEDMKKFDEYLQREVKSFTDARNKAIEYTKSLADNNLSTEELTQAQQALNDATNANVADIVKMDNQTLDNLQNAIDKAQQKMENFAKSAKSTADDLEASLARMKGDDSKSRELQQTRKLTALEEKLNQAKQRGNQEEIQQLQRALNLQKQINSEENKQAEAKKKEKANREKRENQRSKPKDPATQSTSKINSTEIDVKELANVIDDNMIKTLKNQGAKEMINQLTKELKRRAN
ncbi:MAG: tape measure protein [Moraxellaceae bacterium]|nr:tape measure protein [Moraxellaceae bacterium]